MTRKKSVKPIDLQATIGYWHSIGTSNTSEQATWYPST